MKYQSGTRRRAKEYESEWVKTWREEQTFEESIARRSTDKPWVFYDGPPFLTGTPHHGHLLVSTLKDSMGRYKTMQGYRVERRWGWDCHGLPAEVFVEKQLGITSKKEIGTKISIPDYVAACRALMVKTGTEWEDTIDRLGRWVEFEGAYRTMDNDFMESVWWAFKTLHDKGKIYEGEKILVYCTKDETPISKSEVAMENSYQTVTDPSLYVYFNLEGSDESLLVWTTTPWTLPANVALAVNEGLEYSLVEYGARKFYVASTLVEKVMTDEKHQALDYKVLKTVSGSELAGRDYQPLFTNRGPRAHRILAADFVTDSDGSGVVHIAPAYGEDDHELSRKNNLPIVSIVDGSGDYTEGPWQGENIWNINKDIAKTMVSDGRALKVDYIRHEYPHCHRCGTKLMYRAHPSWFMDIQGQKDQMLEEAAKTNWTPTNLKEGRFHNIIDQAPDWNLSRDRYWATPIPVWKGETDDGTEVVKVLGSYDELEELAGVRLDDYHLPQVMDITFELDGVTMKHIGKVLDCWFESGSMPFAQFHYPFENKELFERSYPADFVTEAIDQTRGWFYSMMAVNVGLFGTAPFKNLICTGFINAADGKKMSKKLKNYTDPLDLMDSYSADSFRMLMMSSPLTNGENFALADKDVGDVARKLSMIWNMYDFFTMYAEVDGWESEGDSPDDPLDSLTNPLDIWVVSKLHKLMTEVEAGLDAYDFQAATRPILPFIDDASNWYVRRSRRRFWKGGLGQDKDDAFKTLHYVLVKLAYILAPFAPFLSEELFRKMTGSSESIHLKSWPKAGGVNEDVLTEMDAVRDYVNQGLRLRAIERIKVRQPLASVTVPQGSKFVDSESILKEELNVKQVIVGSDVAIDTNLTEDLRQEGFAREVIRHVQSLRKRAGLNVDDRIVLSLVGDGDEFKEAYVSFKDLIASETLAESIDGSESVADALISESVKVNGVELVVSLDRYSKN